MSVETSLRTKYGLSPYEPTQIQAQQWGKKTKEYINLGFQPETAGDKAAKEIFPSYRKYIYHAEADTIYDLLRRLGG